MPSRRLTLQPLILSLEVLEVDKHRAADQRHLLLHGRPSRERYSAYQPATIEKRAISVGAASGSDRKVKALCLPYLAVSRKT